MNIATVIAERKMGKSMWDIAADLYLADHPEVSRETIETIGVERTAFEDAYLYGKGGVADIVMEYENVSEDCQYDRDGGMTLIAAIISSAVKDFGEAETTYILNKDTGRPNSMHYNTAKNFFYSKQYESYMDCLSNNHNYPFGDDMISLLKTQAREGRWMKFNLMHFATNKEAQKMIDDHPKYTEGAKIYYSKKAGCYKIKLPNYDVEKKEETAC